ncbi:PLP-dependent aminotransferase family protein [Streptomyces sp. NPDC056486]|uniref:MocR-like pyridoxine biosynthesis transcription factor PdxR n=1 Tax=Streptomyces sp. NPDC056486 TaxID=3345835 RepID=UPI0036925A44
MTSQIQKFIRGEIETGILRPGTRLPATRRLAEDLEVARSVVVEAYGQLTAEGYLESRQGAGTRVVQHLPQQDVVPVLLDNGRAPAVRWDLRTGGANTLPFPHTAWLTAYQRVLQDSGRRHDYPPLAGEAVLRGELARLLGRWHGVLAVPGKIVVVGGFAQGLGLLCTALRKAGLDEMAVEDPGHVGQRRFIEDTGMRTVAVPVDEEGLDVGALAATSARVVLVTPAHQFPVGVTMSERRRAELIEWARDTDSWVIEDDYDGGLWYGRTPRPLALQRLAPERVVYAGTASKLLGPGLRLGWLAAPDELLDGILHAKVCQDLGTESFTQLAFAELLGSGLFDRHVRRLVKIASSRRDVLEDAVRRRLPGATVLGAAAGLHAYVRLPHKADEAAVVAGALRRSVLVRGGAGFHSGPTRDAPALVVGHAHLPRAGVAQAIDEIAAAVSAR